MGLFLARLIFHAQERLKFHAEQIDLSLAPPSIRTLWTLQWA
jgi:hypothetical protein